MFGYGVRGSGCVLSLALLILLAAPGQASAAIVGLETASNTSVVNSSNKGAVATCPLGKKVVGAGADVTPGFGEVTISRINPTADLSSVYVAAREDDNGTGHNWSVQALAICAFPPPGLERVSAFTAQTSTNKGVVFSCPTGKRVLGAGAAITPDGGEVQIAELRPNTALTHVTVNAVEDEDGTAVNWRLFGYAICANPLDGLQRVASVGPSNSSGSKVQMVGCPSGKGLLGLGGDIISTGYVGQLVLDAVFPDPAELTPRTAGFAAWEDATGTPDAWRLVAYGICANAADVYTASSANNSDQFKNANGGVCPAPLRTYGAGYQIDSAAGNVLPLSLQIDETSAAVDAIENENGFAGNWQLHGKAICGTPLPGMTIVEDAVVGDTGNNEAISAPCPDGTRAIGVGGGMFPVGAARASLVRLLSPDVDLSGATAASSFTGYADPSPFFLFQVYARCANPPPGLELVTATSPWTSAAKSISAFCPVSKFVTGTGIEVLNGFGEVVPVRLTPNPPLSSVTATAFEAPGGLTTNWALRVFAVCANR